MKYTIKDLKKRHIDSINKDVIEASLEGTDGTKTDKVQIWQTFPSFETITFGTEVEGNLETKTKGNFTNITLYPISTPPANGNYPKKANMIGDAMKKKEASIEKFQDNKEASIKNAGTMRDATLLTVAMLNSATYKDVIIEIEEVQTMWTNWRKWLEGKADEPFS